MIGKKQGPQLPFPAIYHTHNYSSDQNWIGYQMSQNQVHLIQYDKSSSMISSFSIKFDYEPIKQIKIIFDKNQKQIYTAIVFLTKYVIYKENKEITAFRLKLDRNIVSYQNTFVACDVKSNLKQIYFQFLTSFGEIHIVPVDNLQNKSIVKINSENRLCSIKILDSNVVVGDQKGQILLLDLNNSSILKIFNTNSFLPILHLGYLNNRIIAATCQGQIYSLNQNLTSFTAVSSHNGFITHMEIGNQKIITFGDDCILNVFSINNQSKDLILLKSQKNVKRCNLIATLFGSKTFINFYEELTTQQVD